MAAKCLALSGRAEGPAAPAGAWEVVLPLVPSTNNLYYNARWGGRRRTDKYEAWIEAAAPAVSPLPVITTFPVAVSILIRGTKGFPVTADVANREKGVVDLIVALGKLPADDRRHVKRVVIEHADGEPGVPADMLVRITPYKSDE